MRLPATPGGALWSYLWRRWLLCRRGLGYRRRDASEISAAELTRDRRLLVGRGGPERRRHDPRAPTFSVGCLLLAFAAGERSRIARSLAMEAAHSSTDGLRRHSSNGPTAGGCR